MSLSKIDICNMALARAGSTTEIQSLDFSGSQAVPAEARLCKLYWEQAFKTEARCHDWKCLTAQADISAKTSIGPIWEYDHAYSLPADCIRVLRVNTDFAYVVRGRKLYTDETTVQIEYIRYTEDTDLLDALFVEALILRLAMSLVRAFGGEQAWSIEQALLREHEMFAIPSAILADASEQSTTTTDSTDWRNARRRG